MTIEDRLAYWKRRARDAERAQHWAEKDAEHARQWAREQCEEQRRLADRLAKVGAAAAAVGVDRYTVFDIVDGKT